MCHPGGLTSCKLFRWGSLALAGTIWKALANSLISPLLARLSGLAGQGPRGGFVGLTARREFTPDSSVQTKLSKDEQICARHQEAR
jgi:hypothetical protein